MEPANDMLLMCIQRAPIVCCSCVYSARQLYVAHVYTARANCMLLMCIQHAPIVCCSCVHSARPLYVARVYTARAHRIFQLSVHRSWRPRLRSAYRWSWFACHLGPHWTSGVWLVSYLLRDVLKLLYVQQFLVLHHLCIIRERQTLWTFYRVWTIEAKALLAFSLLEAI